MNKNSCFFKLQPTSFNFIITISYRHPILTIIIKKKIDIISSRQYSSFPFNLIACLDLGNFRAHNKSQNIHPSIKKLIFDLVNFCLSTNITLWWVATIFLIGINVTKQTIIDNHLLHLVNTIRLIINVLCWIHHDLVHPCDFFIINSYIFCNNALNLLAK